MRMGGEAQGKSTSFGLKIHGVVRISSSSHHDLHRNRDAQLMHPVVLDCIPQVAVRIQILHTQRPVVDIHPARADQLLDGLTLVRVALLGEHRVRHQLPRDGAHQVHRLVRTCILAAYSTDHGLHPSAQTLPVRLVAL